MKIGVLGPNGFIGSAIKETGIPFIGITRENYNQHIGQHFDILINLAGNKKSFWANQHPNDDFQLSTAVVYKSLVDFSIDKYVFFSSVAVYDENSHYGFNKLLSEQIIKRHAKKYLIIRASNIIDKNMDIGMIHDIKNNIPLFLTNDSEIQFITKTDIVRVMFELIEKDNLCLNVGGKGTVRISELQDILGKQAILKPDAKYRKYSMDISDLLSLTNVKTSKEYVKDIL